MTLVDKVTRCTLLLLPRQRRGFKVDTSPRQAGFEARNFLVAL